MKTPNPDEVAALLTILHIDDLTPKLTRTLLQTFSSAQAVCAAGTSALLTIQGMSQKLIAGLRKPSAPELIARELEVLNRLEGSVVCCCDEQYPAALAHIYDPPAALFYRGKLDLLACPALAIVGTRRPTHYGLTVARQLSGELAKAGFSIISGLAQGIDTEVHRACLEVQGNTVAVLGNGLAVTYPQGNKRLADEVAAHGLLLTEFTPFAPPKPYHFPIRNRIIAGLSLGVIVVEASDKSGALITANHAVEQGREVFAVPGPITSPQSVGPHGLIKQGAVLVGSIDDILVELPQKFRSEARLPNASPPAEVPEPLDGILKHLGFEPVYFDELVAATGLSAAELAAAMTQLELLDLVVELPGKRYLKAH